MIYKNLGFEPENKGVSVSKIINWVIIAQFCKINNLEIE